MSPFSSIESSASGRARRRAAGGRRPDRSGRGRPPARCAWCRRSRRARRRTRRGARSRGRGRPRRARGSGAGRSRTRRSRRSRRTPQSRGPPWAQVEGGGVAVGRWLHHEHRAGHGVAAPAGQVRERRVRPVRVVGVVRAGLGRTRRDEEALAGVHRRDACAAFCRVWRLRARLRARLGPFRPSAEDEVLAGLDCGAVDRFSLPMTSIVTPRMPLRSGRVSGAGSGCRAQLRDHRPVIAPVPVMRADDAEPHDLPVRRRHHMVDGCAEQLGTSGQVPAAASPLALAASWQRPSSPPSVPRPV